MLHTYIVRMMLVDATATSELNLIYIGTHDDAYSADFDHVVD